MSFLTKPKPSLASSPTRFGSKLDNKDRFTADPFNNKPKEDIMSGLQVFREGLRKEISGKLTTNLKSLDLSTPTGLSDFKGLHSNLSSNTPGLKGGSFINEKEGSWTSKGLQSRIDIGKEFSKRGEKESPLKQFYNNKSSDPLSFFTQNKESQRASQNYRDLGSLVSKSPFKKNESPKRDLRSTSEIKPLDYFKRENERTYLESGTSPRTVLSRQTDLKGDGSQLLSSRSPLSRENLSSLARTIRERPKSGLLEQAYNTNARPNRIDFLNTGTKLGGEKSSLLRTSNMDTLKNSRYLGLSEYKSSASPYSGSYREDEPKPKKLFNMELKSLGIVSDSNKESTGRDGRDSLANFRAELGAKEGESVKAEVLISDQLPLQRVHEVQDLFYNANEKAFDELSADYIEELVKLSSVIMQRVKGSSYYNRT